jgi:hypothetical protein
MKPATGKKDFAMAKITLNKASRLQDSLRRKLTTLPLKAETTLSIFGAEPAAEVARRAGTLSADIDRADRLLTILADVRASVGQANAESGIASLLAEKAGVEERIKLFSALLPGAGTSRIFGPAPVFRDGGTIAEQVSSMRVRYETGEGGEDTLDTALLDETALATLRERIAAMQRRLEEIGDRLRELNSAARISVADDVVEWLRGEQVI